MESFTKTRTLAIYSRPVIFNLADEPECISSVLEMGCSSYTDRANMTSNVSSPVSLGSGVTSSYNAATNVSGVVSGFPSACASLGVAAICGRGGVSLRVVG